jgi:glycosyltransferase involved in cell wall biosynthesis
MKPVLINGLGCVEGGARFVLHQLIQAYPPDGPRAVLLVPTSATTDLRSPPNVRVVALSHTLFGRLLRPLTETIIWLMTRFRRFSHVVNLSSYGWCADDSATLYFHNDLLLDDPQVRRPFGRAAHWLKVLWLGSCLERSKLIVVQSEVARHRIEAYAARRGISLRPVKVVIPRIERLRVSRPRNSSYDFQFFYPSSGFRHKRTKLARAAAKLAHQIDSRIGLVITETKQSDDAGVTGVGRLSEEEVAATYLTSNALLFTSSRESLGLPLLEALVYGLPAVLPNLPYAMHLYDDAAIYFSDPTPSSVAAAMVECAARSAILMRRARDRRALTREASVSWSDHWRVFGIVS